MISIIGKWTLTQTHNKSRDSQHISFDINFNADFSITVDGFEPQDYIGAYSQFIGVLTFVIANQTTHGRSPKSATAYSATTFSEEELTGIAIEKGVFDPPTSMVWTLTRVQR